MKKTVRFSSHKLRFSSHKLRFSSPNCDSEATNCDSVAKNSQICDAVARNTAFSWLFLDLTKYLRASYQASRRFLPIFCRFLPKSRFEVEQNQKRKFQLTIIMINLAIAKSFGPCTSGMFGGGGALCTLRLRVADGPFSAYQ